MFLGIPQGFRTDDVELAVIPAEFKIGPNQIGHAGQTTVAFYSRRQQFKVQQGSAGMQFMVDLCFRAHGRSGPTGIGSRMRRAAFGQWMGCLASTGQRTHHRAGGNIIGQPHNRAMEGVAQRIFVAAQPFIIIVCHFDLETIDIIIVIAELGRILE